MLPYATGLWVKSLLGHCVLCQSRPIDEGYLCANCHQAMDWQVPDVKIDVGSRTLMVSPCAYYAGVIKKALMAFKDEQRLETLPFLFHALYVKSLEFEQKFGQNQAVVLAVPTTNKRLAARGFYPVGILARYFCYLTGFGLYEGVSRQKDGMHQRGLERSERLRNVKDAFVVEYPPPCRCVILFDDVCTTGATLAALAQVFSSDIEVLAVCLAHGNPKATKGSHEVIDEFLAD